MHHGDGVDISFFEFDCSKVRGQAKVSKVSNAMQLAFIYFGQNLNNRPTEARRRCNCRMELLFVY